MSAEDRPITIETFIFSFVRMNPPTPGHLELVKKLIYKAIELNAKKVYILLSTTVDGKNPIQCEPTSETISPESYKKSILEEMIVNFKQQLMAEDQNPENIPKLERLNVIVRCVYGNPFGTIHSILANEFPDIDKINMFVIVGRDRAHFLDSIAEQIIIQDKINTIDGLILERTGMNELLERPDILEIPIENITNNALSASYVRKLVKHGKDEKFTQLYIPYLSEPQKLFDTIQSKLPTVETTIPGQAEATGTPTPTEEFVQPQSKYFEREHLPMFYTTEQKHTERTRREEERARREEERARKAEEKKRVKTKKSEGGRKRTRKNKRKTNRRF